MTESKERNPLRRRYHCHCDLDQISWSITQKFTIGFFVAITVLYGVLWLNGSLGATERVSVWTAVLLPVQELLSGSRLLDPLALALGAGLAVYSLLLSILHGIWDWEGWRTSAMSFSKHFSLGLLGYTVGTAFCYCVVLYGAVFALVLCVPIAVCVAVLALASIFVSEWAYERLSRVRTRRTSVSAV